MNDAKTRVMRKRWHEEATKPYTSQQLDELMLERREDRHEPPPTAPAPSIARRPPAPLPTVAAPILNERSERAAEPTPATSVDHTGRLASSVRPALSRWLLLGVSLLLLIATAAGTTMDRPMKRNEPREPRPATLPTSPAVEVSVPEQSETGPKPIGESTAPAMPASSADSVAALVAGDYATARVGYARLAAAHPDGRVYEVIARVLGRRLGCMDEEGPACSPSAY